MCKTKCKGDRMKEYKVRFIQKETFEVTVKAKTKKLAGIKAGKMFDEGDYDELGDCKVEQGSIIEVQKGGKDEEV